jgi:lysine 2,3-aminomutase
LFLFWYYLKAQIQGSWIEMERWQKSLAASITDPEDLASHFRIDVGPLKAVVERYPMRITPHYLNLIQGTGGPIWRQCVPDPAELSDCSFSTDPLSEKRFSPFPGLIHRYPDRVVLLLSRTCPTLCRFCMRKHQIGSEGTLSIPNSINERVAYVEKTSAIRDVILSGGDPLLLSDDVLEDVLSRLHTISHVEMIRMNTRAPTTLPDRITRSFCLMLKKFHPLYINTHFNHPREITPESAQACAQLADAGIPLGNQTVLLKGVNDDPEVMKELVQKLLSIRVRPYYIHQMDMVRGTRHFRTSVNRGLEIMAALRGYTSGLAVPYYMIDLPGGKGKVPVLPDHVKREGRTWLLRNYLGEVVEYQDLEE